ncbi:putative urease accessory protein UreD [Helianthus anomalus]
MASIGNGGLLVVIPDPVTCFSTAKYSQKQVFKIMSGSSLLVVDWITSGRHESGEKWEFIFYKSTNHIYMEAKPLFLDTVFSFFFRPLSAYFLRIGVYNACTIGYIAPLL